MTMLSQLADPETIIRAAKGTAEIMGLNSACSYDWCWSTW